VIRVTIWNEFLHEKEEGKKPAVVYPIGIHRALAEGIGSDDMEIATATLEEPEHGLTEERLKNTDVLVWWGHKGHMRVEDAIVDRVQQRVLEGMGLIVLHSGHKSKIFRKLMGTSGNLKWREVGEKERLWVVNPSHPIAKGIYPFIELEHEEMYGEHFDVPEPLETVFVSWFAGGEVFRSGITYQRGQGRIFYFRPGHESYPTYYNKQVLQVIGNAVRWAAANAPSEVVYGKVPPQEKLN
jgi:trehalose utilization protein